MSDFICVYITRQTDSYVGHKNETDLVGLGIFKLLFKVVAKKIVN